MERELWSVLYQLAKTCDSPRWWGGEVWRDHQIVAVYCWAVLHERPTCWACQRRNWPKGLWPWRRLPSQATMSRRLRTTEVQGLLHLMAQRLLQLPGRKDWVTIVDGKPLVVGTHSKDGDSQWGHVGHGYAKGYKFHALYTSVSMPVCWELAPLNVGEPEVAARLIPAVKGGGYLLGDKQYDSNPLHDVARRGDISWWPNGNGRRPGWDIVGIAKDDCVRWPCCKRSSVKRCMPAGMTSSGSSAG